MNTYPKESRPPKKRLSGWSIRNLTETELVALRQLIQLSEGESADSKGGSGSSNSRFEDSVMKFADDNDKSRSSNYGGSSEGSSGTGNHEVCSSSSSDNFVASSGTGMYAAEDKDLGERRRPMFRKRKFRSIVDLYANTKPLEK